MIEVNDRVSGDAGVFYVDRPATGTVLNFVEPDCVHVLLDDNSRAVVPIDAVKPMFWVDDDA